MWDRKEPEDHFRLEVEDAVSEVLDELSDACEMANLEFMRLVKEAAKRHEVVPEDVSEVLGAISGWGARLSTGSGDLSIIGLDGQTREVTIREVLVWAYRVLLGEGEAVQAKARASK